MSKTLKVNVIGAGIGGLVTGIVMKRAGFDVEVYERQPILGAAGAGIVLWPNAVKILNALGLGEELAQIGHRLEIIRTYSSRGNLLTAMPVGELEHKLGAPVYPVSRTDLQAMLTNALGEKLHLGAKCVRAVQQDSQVTAHFEDGRSVSGDLLVGADGIHSIVRKESIGDITSRYSGMVNWVTILPNQGRLADEHTGLEFLGEGKRCGLLPLSGGRLYVGFAAGLSKGSIKSPSGRLGYLRELFHGWPGPIPALLNTMDEEHVIVLEIHDLPALDTWSKGHITLVGDAAHATTPTMGQGGCQAMEDAIVLARCLGSTSLGIRDGLRRYEAQRKARAEEIVMRSRKKAESLMNQDPTATAALLDAIKASSIADTMKAQEELLIQGPFG